MNMLASTEKVKAVHLVVMLVASASLAAVSDAGVVAARRRDSPLYPAAVHPVCKPTTEGVAPALCEVCYHMPDRLVDDCCRWCLVENTYIQRDTDDELGAATDAEKRAKYFLGKRPKYFLGK